MPIGVTWMTKKPTVKRCTKHETRQQAKLSVDQHDRIIHGNRKVARLLKLVCPNSHPGGCFRAFCQLCEG